jgi:hypothetical protein
LINFDGDFKYANGVDIVTNTIKVDAYVVCSATLIGDRVERM